LAKTYRSTLHTYTTYNSLQRRAVMIHTLSRNKQEERSDRQTDRQTGDFD